MSSTSMIYGALHDGAAEWEGGAVTAPSARSRTLAPPSSHTRLLARDPMHGTHRHSDRFNQRGVQHGGGARCV